MSRTDEVLAQGIQATPSVAAATVTMVLGMTLNDWLAAVSIAFIALQAVYLVWKWVRELRRRR